MGLHRVETLIVDWIGYITFFIFALLFLGILRKEPTYFIEFIFLFKVGISIFLMYRFNDFRKEIRFTDLDRKVVFLAGVNLFLLSFADLIKEYMDTLEAIFKIE